MYNTLRLHISHKVVVTLPLALLKSGNVQFTPALPVTKLNAIKTLGAGLIEKVGATNVLYLFVFLFHALLSFSPIQSVTDILNFHIVDM